MTTRSEFLLVAGSVVAVAAMPRFARAAESDFNLQTATGTIYGTLSLPAAPKPPVVLIIAGSGPTDRNGNSSIGGIHPDTYKLLADGLAAKGVASVRYDKRGVGASLAAGPAEIDLRFDTYVGDAAAWLEKLRADGRFSRAIVAGHSEGSLIGMIAAQKAPASAFVSLEGAGRPAATILREQLKRNLSGDLYAQSDAIIAQLQEGHTVANTPAELASLFRPSVQPYLISWFKYDPAAEIAKLRVRATIVQGTADVQVSMTDANDLKAADPSARFVVVDGMNHVLKYAPDTSSQDEILAGYTNPALPVDPKALDAVFSATVA
jgi:uncharacterized protein